MTQLLQDIRVTDLSIVTAGAGSTAVLADFGANVIKIEAPEHPEQFKDWTAPAEGEPIPVPEKAPRNDLFRTMNRNKRAIAVDLKNPEGLEIVRRLVAISDVVVENFRRGAIERLGLGFDEIVKLQEKIVLVSIASQGATGPNVFYGSFGSTLDGLGGIASITGYDATTPMWSSNKVNYPDQLVSIFAPAMIVAGIISARESGSAKWIDLSQRELVTNVVGEHLLHRSITGIDPVPMFNQGLAGLEWVSPCQGEDEWIAISILDDGAWQGLCNAIGRPDLSAHVDFSSGTARVKHTTELERIVAEWTSPRDKVEVMSLLQGAGVPAAAVRTAPEELHDPFLESIAFYHEVETPPDGSELQRGYLVRYDDKEAGQIHNPAPFVGEHTVEVLTSLLGYTMTEIERFMREGIVSGS